MENLQSKQETLCCHRNELAQFKLLLWFQSPETKRKSSIETIIYLLLTVLSTATVRKGILSRVKRLIVVGIDL